MSRSLRLGITGKIGGGKSTVSEVLRAKGVDVLDTDSLAKHLMLKDVALRQSIKQLLGESAYSGDELNRVFVAEQIFGDPSKRLALEALVHPAVSLEIEKAFLQRTAGEIVAVESALIFQTDLWRHFDYIILVDSTDENVIARLTATGKFSSQDIVARLREQNWKAAYKQEADFVIENNSTLEELKQKIEFLFPILTILSKQPLPLNPRHQNDDEEEFEEGELNDDQASRDQNKTVN